MISEKRYFAVTLILPLIVPLAILLVGNNAVTSILFLSLWFGCIPYSIFALLLILWARRSNGFYVRKLSYISPVLFIPMQVLYLSVVFFIDRIYNAELTGLGGSILVSSLYILVIGYAYVLVVNFGYLVLIKMHIIDGSIRSGSNTAAAKLNI